MKAVVVLSGGQDSALCLALALKRHGAGQVAAITFSYGQRHAAETSFAKRLVRQIPAALGLAGPVPHKVVRLDFYRQLTTNSLLDPSRSISRAKGAKCPNTVVEGRNAVFLQLAAVWAKTLGATELYTGVSEADFSGYPDCRGVFVRAQQRALRLALDYPVRIVTPFLHLTKSREWALAAELGIFELVKNGTVTCYNGIPGAGCGKCPACRLRRRGLMEYERSLRGR